jgi:hypothetical protein
MRISGLWIVISLLAVAVCVAGVWDGEVRLTYLTGPSSLSRANARCIAVDGNDDLHVVWFDEWELPLIPGIYYKTYDGVTWTSPVKLNDSGDETFHPAIAADAADRLHVVWSDYRHGAYSEVYYKRFDGTWGTDTRLTNIAELSGRPSIATYGDDLHVVWEDLRMGNWEIYYLHYDGVTWKPEERLTTSLENSQMPAVAVDTGGRVHVAWSEGDTSIHYTRFDGATWSPPMPIDGTSDAGVGPALCSDDFGGVHITWHAVPVGESNLEVYYRHYDGLSWLPVERLTNDPGRSSHTSVAADAFGNIHVIWSDTRDGDEEIYHTLFDGSSWQPENRVSHADGESMRGSAATDSEGDLHVIWQDDRDGNDEIYYNQRDAGLSGIDEASPVTANAGLLRIAPNPVRGSTRVSLLVKTPSPTSVAIYDISGRLVWKRGLGVRKPGLHQVTWDGSNLHGRPVEVGVYVIKAVAGAAEASAKVVVAR